jgi:hypothetical protein
MDLHLRANLGLVCTALLVCAGVLAAGPARADQLVPTDQSASEASGPPGGKYGGVTPEGKENNPLPQAPASPPSLIWTGFQPTATGSRVFFQTTGLVEFEVKEGHLSKAGHSTLTVLLRGCRIFMANNRRKLDTRAFVTPVQSISAKQRRKDVEVLITLREPASSTPGTEAGPNGTRFLVFDFPPGKPAPLEEKSPAGPVSARRGGVSSGEGWSLSGRGDSVQAEAKGKAKFKGTGQAAVAPDQGAPEANPALGSTPAATPPAGAK